MFIGLACLPQRFQPLPKEHECTIIGWGKRRSIDQNGTNLLHEAEVSETSSAQSSSIKQINIEFYSLRPGADHLERRLSQRVPGLHDHEEHVLRRPPARSHRHVRRRLGRTAAVQVGGI